MKVLIVNPHIFAGGAEKAILNLAYEMKNSGCQVCIATLSLDLSMLPSRFKELSFLLPENSFGQPELSSVKKVILSSLSELLALIGLVRRYSNRFDLICPSNFPSYWATYLSGVNKPKVWLSNEVLAPYNQTKELYTRSPSFRVAFVFARFFDRLIVNRSISSIVTCSKLNSLLVKERYGRCAKVINTGVDFDLFHTPENLDIDLMDLISNDKPLFIQVGALVQRKNQILSIQALKKLKPKYPNAKLILVGKGPWQYRLTAEVERLNLKKDVIFLGSVSESMLRGLYQNSDVNLFPGDDQTWGLVPFEALAAGTISVVSEGCGASEVIKSKNIGFAVKSDAGQLADAISYILENSEIVKDMILRGQKFVRETLSWQEYASQVCDFLEKVL